MKVVMLAAVWPTERCTVLGISNSSCTSGQVMPAFQSQLRLRLNNLQRYPIQFVEK